MSVAQLRALTVEAPVKLNEETVTIDINGAPCQFLIRALTYGQRARINRELDIKVSENGTNSLTPNQAQKLMEFLLIEMVHSPEDGGKVFTRADIAAFQAQTDGTWFEKLGQACANFYNKEKDIETKN